MTERDFQSLFRTWAKENILFSAAFELKCVDLDKKKSISFVSDFQPQQIPSLKKAKESCIYHKLSDLVPGAKPFDVMQICNSPAFVVILFYQKRIKKRMYMIDVDDWVTMQKTCGRQSANEKMVACIAIQAISL